MKNKKMNAKEMSNIFYSYSNAKSASNKIVKIIEKDIIDIVKGTSKAYCRQVEKLIIKKVKQYFK